jgi:hypothetical protein
MKNGSSLFKGDNLVEGGLRVFEIDCPELEKLIIKSRQEEKSITLLGIEVFDPLPKPVEAKPATPPALLLATPIPLPPPNPTTLKQRIRDRLRWHKATAAPAIP